MGGIKLDRRDGVLTIALSRPERLNAVDGALTEEMLDVLNELARDPDTQVVVLTGEGRGFCSGMDIQGGDPGGETAEGRAQRLYRGIARGGEVTARLREIPQPVIVALHGPVAGMGVSWALAGDLRVADPTTRFVVPFVNLGLSAGDCGLSWLLPRLVGPAKAAEIAYRAQRLDADRADALGLLTEIAPEGGDLAAAHALADELLAKSPYGLRRTKELLNASLDVPGLRRQLQAETAVQTLAFFTEDLAEGMTATIEKRTPRFKNR
ncbi:enoyl-CoA hydratase/isomerase family protein [Actinomadura madurae]|uniref:enoyl-CoA hydratase/isomerase family protein n=1 Tax=Actinomadura madurae TaxID=1993 RepID=UPI002027539B|nr:enoyl-CoA hydratase-related protein [Actinomadura madurae]MCP9954157.1 enoyl-CoA hydratase-related protein [Actinomadura madurae]MCP9970907.1 enoyl-CoA hydratase-related protein [Actinomadura madurae]MCP9983383.1 enoyl-CoA hydratase-related protein [Actinomadura madurae]MCQ0005052.1 enoyl-CoA hydratase-related protein [Actinomadura madurae]URM99648.1 enoyl-CoA hydratase-related protein [Actinomadura madurae]